MRVLALSGSHIKKGNTSRLINFLTDKIRDSEIEELKIKNCSLASLRIKPCKACKKCMERGRCVISDDFGSVAKKMIQSDLIILGSPVYFHDVSGQVKNLIDRTYSLWHEKQLKGKRVIPVAVCAESGDDRALDTIRLWAQAHDMKIVHSVSGRGYKEEDILSHENTIISIRDTIKEITGEESIMTTPPK